MFGPHLIVDVYQCEPKALSDLKGIYHFLEALPAQVGMTAITFPQVFQYKGIVEEDWGITGSITIAESLISLHTFPDRQYLAFDLFSCKDFDTEAVVRRVIEFFGSNDMDSQVVQRGRRLPPIGVYYKVSETIVS